MLKNYFKIAFRNLTRHKAFSFLNISGLAIGMACSILILLWVQHELSYDRFHANKEQIFRVTCNATGFKAAVSPPGMAEQLKKEIPGIKASTRVSKPDTELFQVGDHKFHEKNVFYADSNFLQLFSFTLVKGKVATAMLRPDAIMITEDMAKKYFGDENPMGKIIKKDNKDNLIVTGILANAPSNSHLKFDFVLPMSFLAARDNNVKNNSWTNFNFYTYIQLNGSVPVTSSILSKINQRINSIAKEHVKDLKVKFNLQPLTSIHLDPALQIDLPGHGNIQYVNTFFIVALFIMGIACINFMNLSTARSARRAKEVGLRKVVGAGRIQLIFQFLGESLMISFLSLFLAIALVFSLLPAFNSLAEKTLTLSVTDGNLMFSLLSIAILTGLVAGSYPALFLSGFKPIKVLKGKLSIGGGNLLFRNGLVLLQFVVSIILLAGTIIVYKQLNFIKNKNLGFEKNNLLYMPMNGEMWGKKQALQNLLKGHPLTNDFTIISDLPTNLESGSTNVQWEGKDPTSQTVIPSIDIDENFVNVFQVKMLEGRSFSSAFKGDSSSYVVNETAMKLMGFNVSNAVGKQLTFDDRKGAIIGVVKDFNFKPLQYAIEPVVLRLGKWGGIVVIRTTSANTASSIKALENISLQLNPSYPFSYNFFDKDLENQYRGEQQMGKIFNLFAILAIFISCLGLYGLSAFMAEQRTKEIGVRKVLGASVFNILFLLSGNFTRLILIAVFIAVPVSWYAIDTWLQSFAYRVDISWLIFVAASLTALFIAWLTVSYESVKAAIMNPVKSLRSE
ncbi:MAG: ABC transporter permease [Chitinophagaceae bacterium]